MNDEPTTASEGDSLHETHGHSHEAAHVSNRTYVLIAIVGPLLVAAAIILGMMALAGVFTAAGGAG